MNPEADECDATSTTKDPKRKRVFQRRLLDQLSESRMLEVLDRALQNGRHSTGLSNQEEEHDTMDEQDEEEEEEELVCVSQMVKVANAKSKSPEFQVGGVLNTVRNIHRQRAIQQENQAEH